MRLNIKERFKRTEDCDAGGDPANGLRRKAIRYAASFETQKTRPPAKNSCEEEDERLSSKGPRHRIHQALETLIRVLPTKARRWVRYAKAQRRIPNVIRPSRFTEKIQVVKQHGRSLAPYIDKIEVKNYVAKTIGKHYVIPTIFSGPSLPPQRDFLKPFVIKTNHGSGGNIFVRDCVDWNIIDANILLWLSINYSTVSEESVYYNIEPKIIVEPLVSIDGELPVDFKFFMFRGRCAFVQVDTDRETDHKRTFFSTSWRRLRISCAFPVDERDIPAPASLAEMLHVAAKLAAPFDFVRVDLYEIAGRTMFGELTFTPGSGLERFNPPSVDIALGCLWDGRLQEYSFDIDE